MQNQLSITLAALALAGAGCSSPSAVPKDPEEAFATLEQRLLEAPQVNCESHLVAEGAVAADLRALHILGRDGWGHVEVTGTMLGKPVDARFAYSGDVVTFTSADERRELPMPADLRGGLLLGLTRMGWMHNVAMLVMGGWPDATDGKVDDFTRAVHVLGGEQLEVDGRERRALTFGVEVRGQVAATAVLWLDCETGLPLERWQKVQTPKGEMRVVETYERFDLDPAIMTLGSTGSPQE